MINLLDYSIGFVDKKQYLGENEQGILKDIILQCNENISKAEVVKKVSNIALEIAEEHGKNPTIAVSKVKNYMV